MKLARTLISGAIACAVTCAAAAAHAEPVRILVAAGHKLGLAAERPLKFADNDAARVRDVMVSLGDVKRENAFVLSSPTRAQLFATLERAKAEAAKHKQDEVTLFFYFSGHGDREAIHLGDERVLVSELSTKIGEVPAGLRIAVTDACRATRDKGFAADEPFAITASALPQASGQVWLHASSDGEAAQESDELQGAIFTHAWVNGLRGAADANSDARVTLEESFAFAHGQTLLRSAKSSGVLQKPEAVVNLREGAPVVLTQTATNVATLSLPAARDTHFLVYAAGSKTVLSELWGLPDRRTALHVPAGRYVIHRRAGAIAGAAQIALADGEDRKIDDKDFSPASLEMLARKGDNADKPLDAPKRVHAHEVSAGYDVGQNFRAGLVHGPRIGYAYAWSSFAIAAGGGLELTNRSLESSDERIVGGYGRAAFELRVPVGTFALRAGAGGRAGYIAQTITPRGAVPPQPEERRGAFVFGPELVLGVRMGFGQGAPWFVDLGATGSALVLREEGELKAIPAVTGAGSLGATF